jgi:hypothetical protein
MLTVNEYDRVRLTRSMKRTTSFYSSTARTCIRSLLIKLGRMRKININYLFLRFFLFSRIWLILLEATNLITMRILSTTGDRSSSSDENWRRNTNNFQFVFSLNLLQLINRTNLPINSRFFIFHFVLIKTK